MTLREALVILDLSERTLEPSMLDVSLKNRLEKTDLKNVTRVLEAYRKVNSFLNPTLDTAGDSKGTIIDEPVEDGPPIQAAKSVVPTPYKTETGLRRDYVPPANPTLFGASPHLAGNETLMIDPVDEPYQVKDSKLTSVMVDDWMDAPVDPTPKVSKRSIAPFAAIGLGALAFAAGVGGMSVLGNLFKPQTVATTQPTNTIATKPIDPNANKPIVITKPATQTNTVPSTQTKPVITKPVVKPVTGNKPTEVAMNQPSTSTVNNTQKPISITKPIQKPASSNPTTVTKPNTQKPISITKPIQKPNSSDNIAIAKPSTKPPVITKPVVKTPEIAPPVEKPVQVKPSNTDAQKALLERQKAAAKAKAIAKEKDRLARLEQAKIAARNQARIDAQNQTRIDARNQARIDARNQARVDARNQARVDAQNQARIEARNNARLAQIEQDRLNQLAKVRAEARAKAKADQIARNAARVRAKAKARSASQALVQNSTARNFANNRSQFFSWDRNGAVLRYNLWSQVPRSLKSARPSVFRSAVFVAASPASMPDIKRRIKP